MTDQVQAGLCLVLAAATTATAMVVRRVTLGTTLLAPWTWSVVGIWSLALVETLLAFQGEVPAGHAAAWRFIAATAALCPGMAVLGAKRPQDRAWKWIVASLWVVLALPAGKVLLIPSTVTLHLHVVQAWFLPILILLPVINWLPTRYWLSAILLGLGLTLVLGPYFPFIQVNLGSVAPVGGLACFFIASVWAAWQARSDAPRGPQSPNNVWIDFRDTFGAFWALRVAERVNAAVETPEELALGWSGFSAAATEIPTLKQTFDSLLRRFVSRTWIADRDADNDPDQAVATAPTSDVEVTRQAE